MIDLNQDSAQKDSDSEGSEVGGLELEEAHSSKLRLQGKVHREMERIEACAWELERDCEQRNCEQRNYIE
jgi:hypothetical protein